MSRRPSTNPEEIGLEHPCEGLLSLGGADHSRGITPLPAWIGRGQALRQEIAGAAEGATSGLPDVHLSEHLSNFPKRTEQLLAVPLADDGSKLVQPARRVLQRPNRKLSPAEIDQLVADYQAGICLTKLGERYGLHRQTAKAHLERRAISIRSELPALTPDQIQDAGRLYESGLSLVQVSARFEVAPNTLRRSLGRAGFRIRSRGYAGLRLT